MCRAHRQNAVNQQNQQSPFICVHCGSAEHSSANCQKRPWDNREQPCSTTCALRNQQNHTSNAEILGNAPGNATSVGTNPHSCSL